ncbi:cytochrome P450 [Penicillium lagena]|uniref:cytochrome P450 n=1 Tax=Penicillium lagena TaxID=94218 RepID=UPI002540145A|nr:cytochrome P450 [Penicillium lagena]KAJ5602034.1 cytochrome P450 [Penicillium lagena]
MIIEPHLWPVFDHLPVDWGTFGRYSRRGWYFSDRGESHRRYGPMWAIVTPVDVYINIADSEAIHDIFQRRTDFIRPSKMYKVLEVYGPCISTASWTDWPRHRKVLATPFNENIMSFVWDESLEQSSQMLDIWAAPDINQIPSIAKDTRTLSLNVLAATGFRKSYPFRSANGRQEEKNQETANYRDALQTVLDNCILLMIAPRKMLTLSFAPKRWHILAKAADDFKHYMVRMLNEETKALNEGKTGSGGLMTSFVHAMDLRQKEDTMKATDKSPRKGLTSITVTKGRYAELFPRLTRCKAVMLKTLRHFPPIPSLPKWTSDQLQALRVGEKTVIIPPSVGINPSILTMHIHPQHWEDPLAWKPSRWVTISKEVDAATTMNTRKSSLRPVVEFVAVMANLFHDHRICAIQNAGETPEQTRERILATTRDVDLQLLLRMRDADQVRLMCKRM